jgi:EAL domain-containing protein (putative c-di-GMP-specific phosphodiesterase class I)
MTSSAGTDLSAELDAVIDRRLIRAVFQPIVDLDTGEVVAFEGLARGPAGSPLEAPEALFAAAAAAGRVSDLDWVCRAAAYRSFLERDLGCVQLLVNCEPSTLGTVCPADLQPVMDRAAVSLRTVVEVTERGLTTDPSRLLDSVRTLRAGVGRVIALDDVGAEPDTLAIMPFLQPDIVKLDLSLIQRRTNVAVARVMSAVLAHAERTGAAVLAEGIERFEHVAMARSLGARYGQGWFLGRPDELPAHVPPPSAPIPMATPVHIEHGGSPYCVVADRRPVRRASKRTLIALSRHIETRGLDVDDRAVMLSCLQHRRFFTSRTRQHLIEIAASAAFVAVLGKDMPAQPHERIRGASLPPGDPLEGEWHVLLVGPHFAAGLIARDVGDTGPDLDRRFDYVITHDRDLVITAASMLLERVEPC